MESLVRLMVQQLRLAGLLPVSVSRCGSTQLIPPHLQQECGRGAQAINALCEMHAALLNKMPCCMSVRPSRLPIGRPPDGSYGTVELVRSAAQQAVVADCG